METAIEYASYGLFVLLVVYLRQIAHFYRGLSFLSAGENSVIHSVTVIIPARNEEERIGRCLHALMRQDYPTEKLTIIVIDDQSTDRTAEVVTDAAQSSRFPITLFKSEQTSTIRNPKIRALTLGIQHSLSEIIVTTDADCTAGPHWISSINSYFEERVGVVTGLTVYEYDSRISRLFWGIQFLDFISYTAIAAGAIGLGKVLVGNGSNMAFRIQAFDESGGFDTLTHVNTGDDSLLAQKIVESGSWKARFASDGDARVITRPAITIREALHQRMRWVGQTAYYPPYMMFFMICTFILFVELTVLLPMSLFTGNNLPWIILLLLFTADYFMMKRFTILTSTGETMKYFLPTAFIHIPYILIATVGGYFFSFEWKDREFKKESVQ